ncbi:MAG: hypothetical protein A2Y18_05420 [Clostridiales bacterium GWD2_32_19]|nr:MAG: hypothetical protein A2Y18_05420 [Clostridiales bacterium GWD2_32_19]
MARGERKRSFTGIYHIIISGKYKKNIFLDDQDMNKFVSILEEKIAETDSELYGYCLMENHVHLIIKEGKRGIADVMKRMCISYVCYYNKKYKRVGHLFQGRFKSKPIEDDEYLLTSIMYIHNNPVEAGNVEKIEDYKWSSFTEYTNDKSGMVNVETILKIISPDTKTARKEFVVLSKKAIRNYDMDIRKEKDEIDKEENTKIKRFLKINNISLTQIEKNKILRNKVIVKLYINLKVSAIKIAYVFNLSRASIHLIVRNHINETRVLNKKNEESKVG